MASENVKVEKNHNTDTITELMSLLKFNEISLNLHRFKVKSREIQLKIQNDINSFKLHADLSRLDELRLKKDDALVKFFHTLNELKLELKKAAILIAEMRKLSDPLDISANKENTEQINKKLRALTNRLLCTTSHVKWSYALLKPQLENENSHRKLIASLLLTHLHKETVAQPASALKQEHDSQSRKTPYLSDLILEMNTMISKISLKSTDGVPASKPSMFAEQQPFKAGPTSIQSDTETPSAGISINSKTDIGAKQMTSSLSSTVPEPTKAPSGYFKFEMPSSKTFDFKLPGDNNRTSTLQTNGLPSEPQLNNIEAKSVSKDSSAAFKFTPPLRPFELKQETNKSSNTKPTGVEPTTSGVSAPTQTQTKIFNFKSPPSQPANEHETSKPQISDLSINPNTNIFEAKIPSINYLDLCKPLQAFCKHPLLSEWPSFKPANIQNEDSKPQGTGTASVKFRPHIIVEQVEVNGKSVNVALFHRCITMLKEYENKSLEELRFEDYFRLGAFEKRNNFLHRSVLNAEFKALDAVHVKFHPTTNDYWTSEETEKADRYQSINFMDEFKNRSFEELRLGDYIMARIFHPETFGGCTKALNAVHVKFRPSKVIDPTENENSKFQCITVMDEFRNKSFEELRLLDYVIARVLPPEIFSPNGMGTARVKFEPTTGIDILRKNFCTYVDINVKYQYINSIKEFENKSLEELRLEDYIAGRKGPSLDVVKHHNLQNSHSDSLKSTPSKNAENKTNDAVTKPISIENAAIPPSTTQTKSSEVIDKVKVKTIEPLLEAGKNEEAVEKSNYELELDPENVYALELRARAYYEMKKYREALEDGQKAIGLLPKWSENGYICIVRCYLVLGQIALGQQTVRNAIRLYGQSSALKKLSESFTKLLALKEKALRLMSERKYYDAVYIIDRCLNNYCPACFVMKLLKAECLAHMNKIEEARSIVVDTSLLRTNEAPGAAYADALYVFGLCFYCQEHDEMAIKYFRKVLENDPDHEKAMKMLKSTKKRTNTKLLKETKEKGNKAFNAGEYKKAMKFYNEALSIDKNNKEENAKLHYNRATVFAKQNEIRKAIDACTAALDLDQNYIKPLLRRAQCYTEIKMYEEALEDYEKLYYIESTDEYKRLLKEANKKVMANRGPYYYYKVLGVSKNALMDDIIKAYRKLALRYHPDRHVGASHAELQINERKFKQMKEAYETLSEPRTRANYDLAQERNRAETESEDESD